jgi:hypothetical protein
MHTPASLAEDNGLASKPQLLETKINDFFKWL